MRIVKEGKIPEEVEKFDTCKKCKTEFAYFKKDVFSSYQEGDYIVCPFCKNYITPKK